MGVKIKNTKSGENIQKNKIKITAAMEKKTKSHNSMHKIHSLLPQDKKGKTERYLCSKL